MAHYGEKVYKCTLCNGTFNSKKALETHIKTHAEDGSSPSDRLVLSPSSSHMSQTPQHSDKENRESSDSELSLQNSPPATESLKPSPPSSPSVLMHSGSPVQKTNLAYSLQSGRNTVLTKGSLLSPSTTIFPVNSPGDTSNNARSHHGNGNPEILNHGGNHGYRTSGPSDIPYPMLPPGVEIHQAPQSKTTFLYVTSKLPVVSSNSGSSSNNIAVSNINCNNNNSITTVIGNSKGEVTMTPLESKLSPALRTPAYAKMFSTGVVNSSNSNGITISPSHSSPNNKYPCSSSKDKLLLESATIREKVLAFTEKFGYGLESGEANNNHRIVMSGSKEGSNKPISYSGNMMMGNENLSTYGKRLLSGRSEEGYGEEKMLARKYSNSSNDSFGSGCGSNMSTYTPGGVLALALTRGSKAVNKLYGASNGMPLGGMTSGIGGKYHPGLMRSTGAELSIDLSHHSSSCSNSSSCSGSRSPTLSRSDTPYADQDSSDDQLNGNRKRVSGRGGGAPRKRSSMILEKYAQENSPRGSPSSPCEATVITTTANESNGSSSSILSQRLRLSSVIQYAEKCS